MLLLVGQPRRPPRTMQRPPVVISLELATSILAFSIFTTTFNDHIRSPWDWASESRCAADIPSTRQLTKVVLTILGIDFLDNAMLATGYKCQLSNDFIHLLRCLLTKRRFTGVGGLFFSSLEEAPPARLGLNLSGRHWTPCDASQRKRDQWQMIT